MAWKTVFLEGFYHDVGAMDWSDGRGLWTGGAFWTRTATAGRASRPGLKRDEYVGSVESSLYLPEQSYRAGIVGFAFYHDHHPTVSSSGPLSIDTTSNAPQLTLELNSSGVLVLKRGDHTGTTLATGTTEILEGIWYYLELKFYIDNSAGAYELKINESTEFSGSTVDTQNDGTDNDFRRVTLHSGAYSVQPDPQGSWKVGDMFVRVDSAYTAGGFFGDVKVVDYYPDADGTLSDWSRSQGTTDYENIDERSDISNVAYTVDYLYSSTAADQVTVTHDNVSAGGASIVTVTVEQHFSYGSGSARDIKPVCKSGATTDVGTANTVLDNQLLEEVEYETDPNTASAWTEANLNAAEFGVELV